MNCTRNSAFRRTFLHWPGLGLALVLFAGARANAQDPILANSSSAPTPSLARSAAHKKGKGHPAKAPDGPQPNLSIPVTPLGFAPPAPFYLGDRFVQVSLDFLDEDTLLFTFRVPGLIARESPAAGENRDIERHIRALTLALPTGAVTAEGLWVLHDYRRYLWRIGGGNFLYRDRNSVQIGDASLRLQPFLRFPGTVNALEFDPSQSLLVANTVEAPAPETKIASNGGLPSTQSTAAAASVSTNAGSGSGSASDTQDAQDAQQTSQNLLRILSMDSRKVMLFSRVTGTVHLPLDGEGYYEALRGKASDWLIQYDNLHGGETPVGMVESSCDPSLDALAPNLVLATACTGSGARHLTALLRSSNQSFQSVRQSRDKNPARLWDVTVSPTRVWPQLASSANGLRMARATLDVTHPISPSSPLDSSDIRGQAVDVYDLATGKVALTASASPILDGGGNFALSPSGNRFAVLNDGAIQVFDLPPAPPLPAPVKP